MTKALQKKLNSVCEKFVGKKIKDKISGLEGVCTCVSYFLNGCIRVTIQPPVDKEGKHVSDSWFDDAQITVVSDKKIKIKTSATGGPQTSRPTHSM